MHTVIKKKIAAAVLPIMVISGLLLLWEMDTITDSKDKPRIRQKKLRVGLSSFSKGKKAELLNVHQMEFEPEVLEDIQTINSDTPRIPHIVHFIFISGLKGKVGLPWFYQANVNSFYHFNPNWTYYFWTDESARQLIASRQPALLSTWDNYPLVINKADALRYVLLYEFGGVYADLDMICMRPLDRATMKYSCMLTPEPFEHSAILFRIPFLLSTAFMMCRPKHPFMKQAILSLPEFSKQRNFLAVAGPIFLNRLFKRYNEFQPGDEFRMKTDFESNSPYFYKGHLREDHSNAIYVANTQYFMNSYDDGVKFQRVCNGTQQKIVKRGCFLWNKRKVKKTESTLSYTDHTWAHIYSIEKATRMIPIYKAIPGSKLKIWQSENHEKADVATLI